MPEAKFATFLIIVPTSFLLGAIFSLFPYDHPLLWAPTRPSIQHLDALETHLKLLYHSPPLIIQLLHIVIGVGILGLVLKLYKPTESNKLFDGGSLVLYVAAIVIYIANIIKGLRIVDAGVYGVGLGQLSEDQKDSTDGSGYDEDAGVSVLGREDNLKVLSASNTILALVLVGVIMLQVGQWYAERADEKAKREFEEREEAKREGIREDGSVRRGGSKEKKKQ